MRDQSTPPIGYAQDGFYIVDKAAGMGSTDVVREIKRKLPKNTKIGHGGTLDPFATGVLVVLVGHATKLSDLFLHADKTYVANLRLGFQTTTGDLTGDVLPDTVRSVPEFSSDTVAHEHWQNVAQTFIGQDYLQRAPDYSSKKQDGVRFHTLARQGVKPPDRLNIKKIHQLFVLSVTPTEITFKVTCESGTYVRVLAEDLAKRAGTTGHLVGLRRTEKNGLLLPEDKPLTEPLFVDLESWVRQQNTFLLSAPVTRDFRLGRVRTIQNVLESRDFMNFAGSAHYSLLAEGDNPSQLVGLAVQENQVWNLQRVFHAPHGGNGLERGF